MSDFTTPFALRLKSVVLNKKSPLYRYNGLFLY